MQITLKGSDLQCMHGSVFAMPAALPTERYPTYPSRVASFMAFARDMATEVSDAEKTDADWLNDPEVQAELDAWIDSLNTPEALGELDAWVSEQERIAIEDAEACLIGLNTHHDLIWQAGGHV